MEKAFGTLYKSGDKVFVTEEECALYEKKMAIEEFLLTKGYERKDGYIQRIKSKWHSPYFRIDDEKIGYYSGIGLAPSSIGYKLCDIETFKLFYDNMFIEI